MYICICNAVTDRDIKRAVDAGACTLGCLQEALAVSTCCGQCADNATACLEQALNAAEASISA